MLISSFYLASILCNHGEYEEAEKLDMRALEGREKELRLSHVDTLDSVHSLEYLLHQQKRYEEA
ncbi:hypothetical protein GQ43DRAFT_374760 [Delitschia confertaspora ATCC 74209]|uniref:Tetratricopeptide repeat protein n=1 Tax=Delitschia confertaspora ATCC 74209 TaxID=1513339 RepID=A0A9P4MP01_9PLEO|nr:hypothetical protein GQ43DRAFT_374760 [Delitschia confertaspora ATCC 74209]